MGARTAHALDLGRSSTGSALSALWKTGSVFPVDAHASEAAPLLRAFAQVPWKRSARAMANFHCEVAAYHPLPKTPCAAIVLAISRGRIATLWGTCRPGLHGPRCERLTSILGLSGAVEHAGGASRVSFVDPRRSPFRALGLAMRGSRAERAPAKSCPRGPCEARSSPT